MAKKSGRTLSKKQRVDKEVEQLEEKLALKKQEQQALNDQLIQETMAENEIKPEDLLAMIEEKAKERAHGAD
ncbi:hypothetical protein [Fructobacillus fructosus]|uniref:Uncharacterized protein n=1 Tax=Fructobacillus fructosus TaxID=1631 RepID=A0ABM9N028_9LACO|nr:unnamed protein product [Fructobacillus fructosus]CAK1229224.1 unnamed protein product [Fructobacillus fructosus]CAK1235516.1 unnamed protein product [Fructobacillus fructosus]CAK1245990.1 unnamed protein product [Fructobacillus fructosus]CAK1251962.1 unnamed protein product [Fructobacillus fructosus]